MAFTKDLPIPFIKNIQKWNLKAHTLAADTAASPKWERNSLRTLGCSDQSWHNYISSPKKKVQSGKETVIFTAGASSIIFWCLLCTLQSLSYKWRTLPCLSPKTYIQQLWYSMFHNGHQISFFNLPMLKVPYFWTIIYREKIIVHFAILF